MKEIYRVLKPYHGCVESIEFGYPFAISENNSLPLDAPLNLVLSIYICINRELFKYVEESYRKKLQIMLDGVNLQQLMIEAGFVDINAKVQKVKIGEWGLGRIHRSLSHYRFRTTPNRQDLS